MRERARFQKFPPTPPQTSKRAGRSTTLPILQSSYSMMSPITVTEWAGWGGGASCNLGDRHWGGCLPWRARHDASSRRTREAEGKKKTGGKEAGPRPLVCSCACPDPADRQVCQVCCGPRRGHARAATLTPHNKSVRVQKDAVGLFSFCCFV